MSESVSEGGEVLKELLTYVFDGDFAAVFCSDFAKELLTTAQCQDGTDLNGKFHAQLRYLLTRCP